MNLVINLSAVFYVSNYTCSE